MTRDRTHFRAQYEIDASAAEVALADAKRRLSRSLAVGVDYELKQHDISETDDGFEVELWFELTEVATNIQTNLAFHTFFPDATVEPV